jgi:dolichyl-phosphate-mannose-protein mannosyltransferase
VLRKIQHTLAGQPPLLWTILIAAIFTRLSGLTNFSLSNDELSALARLRFDTLGDVIIYGVYPDFHPAGVQVFLYFWTSLLGFSDFIVRLPFALFGVGTVYLSFIAGRQMFSTNTGLLAAAAMTGLQFPLLYSQLARPYSPGVFFVLLTLVYWSRIVLAGKTEYLKEYQTKTSDYIYFVLGVSLCMYTHYFAFLQAGLMCAFGMVFINREKIFRYLLSGVAIAVLYIPHLNVFLYQVSKGGIGGEAGWLGPPEPDFFEKYFRWSFNDSTTLLWIVFVTVIGYMLSNRNKLKFGKIRLSVLLMYALPFFIGYYYSLHVNPVLQNSVLLFSFPFLLLFLFSFSSGQKEKNKYNSLPVIVMLLACLYSTINQKKYFNTAHFTEFREIAHAVTKINNEYGRDNITRIINIHDPYYILHYLPDNNNSLFDIYKLESDTAYYQFSDLISSTHSKGVFYAWSNMYNKPETEQIIRSRFPCLVDSANYISSGYRLYMKDDNYRCLNNLEPVFAFADGFEETKDNVNYTTVSYSGLQSMMITKDLEYGFFTDYNYLNTPEITLGSIEAEVMVYVKSIATNASLVLSYEYDGNTLEWKGEPFKRYVKKSKSWTRVYLNFTIPDDLVKGGVFKFYCWNKNKERIYLDDVSIKIYSLRR